MPSKRGGYISLVALKDYVRFIAPEGDLLPYIFDSNVRDYQGDVLVNEAIRKTLTAQGPEDFWWLNNGITILATDCKGDLCNLIIQEPQVVNGLQTSREIVEYFRSNRAEAERDERQVLVRILSSTDPDTQNKVIRATNSQTSIPPASLWATDELHRDIEMRFTGSAKLYYDRRKNYWKNRDKPFAEIVGITELAQAVISIVLQEPDMARARPVRYFRDADLYNKVFTRSYPLDIYLQCALAKKRTEQILRKGLVDREHRHNLLFYVLMVVACILTGAKKPTPAEVTAMDADNISESVVKRALNIVQPIYTQLGASDQVAKGSDLVKEVKTNLPKARIRNKDLRSGK
jgi:hypothetical protein